jgi:protein-tyrosine-phosphatase
MNLIFVCKYNRFRSRVAEAYFKHINKNKNIHVSSAGVFKGEPVVKNVINLGNKYGINTNGEPRGLREDEFVKSDLIVIVANNVPASLFKRFKKVIVWKIPDTTQGNKDRIEEIMKEIFKKVDVLVERLRKSK